MQLSNASQHDLRREMVLDRSTGKLRPLANGLIACSAHLDWNGVLVEQHRLSQYDTGLIMWMNHVICLHLGPSVDLDYQQTGSQLRQRIEPGHISIHPFMSECRQSAAQGVDFAIISLTPEFMAVACCDMFSPHSVELSSQWGITDSYAESVCRALLQETLNGSPTGSMYAQSLATSLAVHVASQYGGSKLTMQPMVEGLSANQLKQAIEYVHLHLGEDISLKNMAAAAGLSPFHFARQFKKSMGLSPYQFVLKQRVEKSKQLLVRGEKCLAEIAVDVGFYDQIHFAQQFRRHCGITPKKFVAQCGSAKARVVKR